MGSCLYGINLSPEGEGQADAQGHVRVRPPHTTASGPGPGLRLLYVAGTRSERPVSAAGLLRARAEARRSGPGAPRRAPAPPRRTRAGSTGMLREETPEGAREAQGEGRTRIPLRRSLLGTSLPRRLPSGSRRRVPRRADERAFAGRRGGWGPRCGQGARTAGRGKRGPAGAAAPAGVARGHRPGRTGTRGARAGRRVEAPRQLVCRLFPTQNPPARVPRAHTRLCRSRRGAAASAELCHAGRK